MGGMLFIFFFKSNTDLFVYDIKIGNMYLYSYMHVHMHIFFVFCVLMGIIMCTSCVDVFLHLSAGKNCGVIYTCTNGFVFLFNGCSEFIIDLMGAPGTLIPVEVPCCTLQSIDLDIRSGAGGANFGYALPLLDISSDPLIVRAELDSLTKVDSSDLAVASVMSSQLSSIGRTAAERNQTERFEDDFDKLLPALVRSHEGRLPGGGSGGRTSPAQKLQLNDISNCVINAAKNPQFAQKLHAVLSKSGETSPDSCINVNNKEVGETVVRETVHLLDADMLTFGGQHGPSFGIPSNEQYLISFTEAEISNAKDNSQRVVGGLPKINFGCALPSQSISEDVINDYAAGKEFADFCMMVLKIFDMKKFH